MAEVRTCSGFRKDGQRCANVVRGSAGLCWAHSPENSARRKEIASHAAKAKASRSGEVVQVKDILMNLATDLRAGKVDRGNASVLSQIYGTVLRAFEQERRIKETEEYGERIKALEEAQRRRNGFRSV